MADTGIRSAGPSDAQAGLRAAARYALAALLAVAGVAHFAAPRGFEQIVPRWLPGASELVFITGVMEIGLAIALVFWRRPRQVIGVLIIAFFIAVFPANVYMAVANVKVDGLPGGPFAWIRLPFQALLIAWAWWCTRVPD